jgi:colicin import membrane protein
MQPDINPAADPEVKALTAQAENLLAVGAKYTIANAGEYEVAGLELKRVKDAQKKLDELRKSMTRPIDAAKKAIMDFFRGPESKLAQAETGIKRAMIGYQQEQDRIRREEQRLAEERARKERERLQKQAEKAAAAGKVDRAEQLQERAATVVAPVIQREPPKIAGVSMRANWHAECIDLRALVKAVHEGRAPLSFLMANDKVLGVQARSLKGDFVCDGVRVWSEHNLAAGAA